MKSKLLLLSVSIFCLLLGACAGTTFSVKSEPLQAEVFIENQKTGEKKPIGVTPLEMPLATMRETVGEEVMAGTFFTVLVEKKGFVSQRVNIPATRFGTTIVALEVPLKAGEEVKQVHLANEILDRLFVAQKLAMAKEYERAQVEIDKILLLSPDFSRALAMRGSVYFLQKKYAESMKAYEEVLKIDPKTEEAAKMIARINGATGQGGNRLPASTQGDKNK